MTQNQSEKQFTATVRAVKKALSTRHGIEVPYTALRAAMLEVQGLNAHAKPLKSAAPQDLRVERLAELQSLVVEAPNFFAPQYDFDGAKLRWLERAKLVPAGTSGFEGVEAVELTLHLVGDEAGCLVYLAFDEEGRYVLPEEWTFKRAKLCTQQADIPSVRRYGLPDYLAKPADFFRPFGLNLAEGYEAETHDLGDDSGDSCQVTVKLPRDEFEQLLLAMLKGEDSSLAETTAEWVGLNYHRNFDAEPLASQLLWVERFLLPEGRGAQQVRSVVFEWVYPDEDSGHVQALLGLKTGELSFAQPPADDASSEGVRARIWTGDAPGDGDDVPVYYHQKDNEGVWKVRKKDLSRLA